MRLLVTGASGFIGRNLLLKLPREWEVVATYNKSVDFTNFLSENALENVQAIKVDLANAIETKKKLRLKFDCTVHLAANTDTLFSVKNPEKDLQLNLVTLLNTVKNVKTEDLIFMSSGAVYDGNVGPVSLRQRLNPSFPYAIAKLACERYVNFFKKNNSIDNYVILRFFGAYGPHEPPRKIFTRLVKAFYFENSEEFVIVGDGNNFIDAMYVEDAADGIISVIESDIRDLTVDFASGNPMTINELVKRVAEIFQKNNVKLKHEGWPPEYITFYASNGDMKNLYRFKPSTPLEVGIWKLEQWLEKKCA